MTFEDHRYTVINLNSTGIFKHRDSIVELAAVHVDSKGQIGGIFSSLVRPVKTPLDQIFLSQSTGLCAAELEHAPTFEQIAGDLLKFIKGSILVAHSAQMELGFIYEEFARLGHPLPVLPAICTLKLSYTFGPSDRRLSFCCRHFGIKVSHLDAPHQAAIANALLLGKYIELAGLEGYSDFDEFGFAIDTSVYDSEAMPDLPALGAGISRPLAENHLSSVNNYHASLVHMLPPASSFTTARYFQKLDQSLSDRALTSEEAFELMDLAEECGLSRLQIEAIHQKYLRDLARGVCQDGVVNDKDRQLLKQVAASLGIADYELSQIIDQAIKTPQSAWGIYQDLQAHLAGKKVCFMGNLNASIEGARLTMEEAFSMAQERGLIPVEQITRGLDYLVCDSESFASKPAEEARSRGTQVLAEPIFWKMVGVKVD